MSHIRFSVWVAIGIVLGSTIGVSAKDIKPGDNDYYERKEEGWYWKEKMPEPIEEEKKIPPPPEASPAQINSEPTVKPFSPAWLRDNLPKLLDSAMENPTTENVKAYYYAQRFAMDMSEKFANVARNVTLTDPVLDENNRRPMSTYGADVMDSVANARKEEVAKQIASESGLWYFYRSDCPYCKAENPILERLARRLGLVVLPIAIDGEPMPDGTFTTFVKDKGQSQMLKVVATPTIYMVKKPDQFVLVTEGLVTEQGFIDRMIAGAFEAGWITDAEMDSTRPVNPIKPLTPDEEIMQKLTNGMAAVYPKQ
jgi:conjugal transfer pilus assembly protein TraF